MANFQVIFESRNGNPAIRDGWLDYCREQAPCETKADAQLWASREARALAIRIGHDTRFRIEDWS